MTEFAQNEKRYVIDELLAVITSDFYDVFCVRNIVKIIDEILQMVLPNPQLYNHMCQDAKLVEQRIQALQQRWCGKPLFQVSANYSLEFDRSQQIVQCCNDCLNTISAKLR